MPRHWQPTLKHIVRLPKPSPERFAAAAAACGPDLTLQLKSKRGAIEVPPPPKYDGHSPEIGPRRRGALPAALSRHEVH
jgi:hypothetical protein